MEADRKGELRKMFPHLIKELECSENKVQIDGVRADAQKAEEHVTEAEEATLSEAEEALPDKFRHYSPCLVDFLRRCDTEAQAEEIITYMKNREEITEEYAAEVRTQLKKDGLRSFGSKKEADYYFNQGGLC